ncbi:MAG: hypothetical protein WDO56_30830 [Gammaproteobacteria bacterium]
MTTNFFACLVSALAPLCVYLASEEQRLIRAPLHKAWRVIGLLLAVAGVGIWSAVFNSPASAIFAALSVWTTAYVVLPYISWVKAPLGPER